MNFIHSLESKTIYYEKKNNVSNNIAPDIKVKTSTKKIHKQHKIGREMEKKDTPIKMIIKREETKKDLQQIIKRFQSNKSPALSLFIARKYYEFGDYSQAYNYALTTNQLNKKIEKSWIIFAKSLVKLHKKKDSIKILTQYINASHSNNAMILLNDIKTGKFR